MIHFVLPREGQLAAELPPQTQLDTEHLLASQFKLFVDGLNCSAAPLCSWSSIQVPLRDIEALLVTRVFSFSASTLPTPDAAADLCCAAPGHLQLCRWQMISFSPANSNQGEHQMNLSCCSPSRQWRGYIPPPV